MQRCRQIWAEKIMASLVLGMEAVAVKWNGYEKLQWICKVSVFLLRQAVSFCKSQKFDGKDMQIYAKRYAMINKVFLLGVLVCSIARSFSLLLQTASHTTWVRNSSCSLLQSLWGMWYPSESKIIFVGKTLCKKHCPSLKCWRTTCADFLQTEEF